jgi:hypothetical protein
MKKHECTRDRARSVGFHISPKYLSVTYASSDELLNLYGVTSINYVPEACA